MSNPADAYKARIRQAILDGCENQKKRIAQGKEQDPWIEARRQQRPEPEVPTEYQEQAQVCDWLKARKVYYFAVPNGGSRSSPIEGARLKRIGAKAGVPDLVIVKPAPKHPEARGVALEMKRKKGGRLSDEQAYWLELLTQCGWLTFVAHGADEAIVWLEGLGY